MKILFASWEMDPYFKKGGLGDVASSLPEALTHLGANCRVVLPKYDVIDPGKKLGTHVGNIHVMFDGKKQLVKVVLTSHPTSGVPVYLLANKSYFDEINPATFVFFDLCVAELCKAPLLGWVPDIVHCNDHHTGLIPLLIKKENLSPIKTILTIHNLMYQGVVDEDIVLKTGLKKEEFVSRREDKNKKKNYINMLMEGIVHADVVTTVSPTYAHEIMTKDQGEGLDEVLRGKEGRVLGILNGIKKENFNYRKFINVRIAKSQKFRDYQNLHDHIAGWKEAKETDKKELQTKLKLKVTTEVPILSFVGRIAPQQKGIELIYDFIKETEPTNYQFILLGTGDKEWENQMKTLEMIYPKMVSINLVYNDELAHEIYSGSDFLLIPSRFEPCGLIQMLAMYNGTLPIAHKTGGLKDSIDDDKDGFLFENYSAITFKNAVKKAIDIWNNSPKKYEGMVEKTLEADFSWEKSANQYFDVYHKLVTGTVSTLHQEVLRR
jgi:starch synthase